MAAAAHVTNDNRTRLPAVEPGISLLGTTLDQHASALIGLYNLTQRVILIHYV